MGRRLVVGGREDVEPNEIRWEGISALFEMSHNLCDALNKVLGTKLIKSQLLLLLLLLCYFSDVQIHFRLYFVSYS